MLTNPCDAFRGQSRSITKDGTIRYGFLLVFYSKFVPKTHRFFFRYLTSKKL